jgi:hypothetical protein
LRSTVQIFLLIFCFCFSVRAQEPATIKVRKESNLAKAAFDNTSGKLVVMDRFGNPKENKIVSYKLWIKSKDVKGFNGFDNKLNRDMMQELNGLKKATKIFFTELKAVDDEGHVVELPDLVEMWFPDCKNCEPVKKRQ